MVPPITFTLKLCEELFIGFFFPLGRDYVRIRRWISEIVYLVGAKLPVFHFIDYKVMQLGCYILNFTVRIVLLNYMVCTSGDIVCC